MLFTITTFMISHDDVYLWFPSKACIVVEKIISLSTY